VGSHREVCNTTTLHPGLNSGLSCFWMTNKFVHISRNESRSFQSGMDAISPNQNRCSPERLPIIYVAHVICWTPCRQPAVGVRHTAKHVLSGQIWQGSRESDIFWQNYTLSLSNVIMLWDFKATGVLSFNSTGDPNWRPIGQVAWIILLLVLFLLRTAPALSLHLTWAF